MSEAPNHGSCVVSPVGLAALAGAFLLGGCGASAQSACATGCAAPLVCERAAPVGCQDPTWAAWPMPNAPADVATGAPTPMAYTIDSRNGTVTDLITSLMWQQAVGPNQQYTWREALAYCA